MARIQVRKSSFNSLDSVIVKSVKEKPWQFTAELVLVGLVHSLVFIWCTNMVLTWDKQSHGFDSQDLALLLVSNNSSFRQWKVLDLKRSWEAITLTRPRKDLLYALKANLEERSAILHIKVARCMMIAEKPFFFKRVLSTICQRRALHFVTRNKVFQRCLKDTHFQMKIWCQRLRSKTRIMRLIEHSKGSRLWYHFRKLIWIGFMQKTWNTLKMCLNYLRGSSD
jgi:hypothetical protein